MRKIAKHQRRRRLPGQHAQRGKVRPHLEIAEAFLPVGQLEAVLRVHFDVDGQQIITPVRAALRYLVQKKLSSAALADEPPENVRGADDHGVYGAALDLGLQSVEVHLVLLLGSRFSHIHVFEFGVTVHGRHAEVAADATLLEAAKGGLDVDAAVGVDA